MRDSQSCYERGRNFDDDNGDDDRVQGLRIEQVSDEGKLTVDRPRPGRSTFFFFFFWVAERHRFGLTANESSSSSRKSSSSAGELLTRSSEQSQPTIWQTGNGSRCKGPKPVVAEG
jgi:hypothetical protein